MLSINLNNDKHQSAQVKRTKAVDVVNCNQREMQLTYSCKPYFCEHPPYRCLPYDIVIHCFYTIVTSAREVKG